METTWSGRDQPRYARPNARHDDILVDFNGAIDEPDVTTNAHNGQPWQQDAHSVDRRHTTKRSSKSFSTRMSRQKSRRRVLGKSGKMGITLDTNVTRHKGNQPQQVFASDDIRSGGSIRKNWFSGGRSSFKNKGLGITKGTPQPDARHRRNESVDQSELLTAISLTPGSKAWQDISPWDRRIPIGISVPTDSVSDFSSLHGARHRSGSDATLVTPNIVITPAEATKSVWSPDTPFSESDYTPSVQSRAPFGSRYNDSVIPPVPAIPAGVGSFSGIEVTSKSASTHVRNDTLDSAGTAFEEDEDVKRRDRIMSTGTVFEEDETPLRERTLDAPTLDTSLVPTPRRSQGWWNVITTPFVATPNTAVFPRGRIGEQAPVIPAVPVLITPASTTETKMANTEASKTTDTVSTPPTTSKDLNIVSPLSVMPAPPVVGTAAFGTVLMPLQIEEPRRPININIELQDRRPVVIAQATRANTSPITQQTQPTTIPKSQFSNTTIMASRTNSPGQTLPVFAPPPSQAAKGSHFSYDPVSRTISPVSTEDLKGKSGKKHRKVTDLMSCIPFGKRKQKEKQEEKKNKKKKKRGVCFWGCCCCLLFLVILAIIIPLTVVLTRRRDDKPSSTTLPDQGSSSGWLNLPNYPPIPTGVSTVSQPEAVVEQSGCVAPTTLWSCALPKEMQDSIKPNKPNQPNFRVQITYQDNKSKRAANAASAGAFVRSQLLKIRAATSSSPAPPSISDMSFLGKTTDGNAAPFEGETTGLSLTFLDVKKTTASRMTKRAGTNDPTNITLVIPPPALEADGTAAAANLLPMPVAQPLRLFNRGKDNEYYGFYTYFDRSIFLKQINGTNRGGNPADVDGGSPKTAANMRCTFSETRFLVQIWTRSQQTKKLLQGTAQNASDASKRPGTFPYPVTFTLDRHGGDPAKKNLYCYAMESDGTIKNIDSKKSFQFEDRSFGGVLVNGTQGRPTSTGPIDGGTGGCRCQWQNFLE